MTELQSQTELNLESAPDEKGNHALVSLTNQQTSQSTLPSVVSKTSSDRSKQSYEIWRQSVVFDEAHAAEEALIRLTLNVNSRGVPLPRQKVGADSQTDSADATLVYDWDSIGRHNERETSHNGDHTKHENNDKESDEVGTEEDEEEIIEPTTFELIRSQLNTHPQLIHHVTTHGHVTALIAAVWVGSTSLTELFLQHGADVNRVDECGRSALWWAARFRRVKLTRLLLTHGADPTLKDTIEQRTPCHVAAAYHAVGVLRLLLEHSTKETFINATDAAGFTPLHLTLLNMSSSSHVEKCVELLVTHGADPTLRTREHKTVLHLLCERGGPASLVPLFLSHEVDADARDAAGYTALHSAVIHNHALFLNFLLDKFEEYFQHQESTTSTSTSTSTSKAASQQRYYSLRSLINRATEPHGLTALHLAVIHQHFGCLELLLQQEGIRSNVIDRDGKTPLHYAVCLPSREIVEVLVKRELVDVNVKDNRGRTPLFYAALHGRDEYIELLVNYGARVTERADSDLTTPLHWACWAGHAKCVRRLLQERRERDRSYSSVRTRGVLRADPYARDERGRTPLHALMYGACKRGHLRALDVLLRYPNFDVEVYDVRGRTPLHILAQRSTIESQLFITLAQRLLAHGARLDRQDDFGCTALHYAAFAGNEELVRLFVKSNARLWIRDVGGRLPLHYAARRGHLNTLLVLLEAYDHSPTPTNELNVSPLLIPDVKGTTPLHILAQSGHTEVLNSVLGHTTTSLSSSRRSLTLDVTDQRGRTPLHCAVLAGQEPFAMALIRANARTDLRTSSGMSVVHCACASPRPLCSLVRTLLTVSPQLGVLHVDQSQRTPLHFAAAAGNAEIVDLLLSWDKSLRDVMLSQCDSQGRTPLHAVLCRDTPHHRQSLQLILQHASETYGATLKSTFIAREDHAGQTALHYAAALKTTTDFAVDQLLSHGAEVNCPDRRGLRPVHMAIKVKNLAALQRLLTVGGELLNVRDHKNRALVLWACFWLRPSEDLHSFESLHNDPIVQMWDLLLNRYQLDLTATDRSGATCLHYLAWLAPSKKTTARYAQVMQAIVDLIWSRLPSATRQAVDVHGRTALHIAAWRGHTVLMECLLTHGIEFDARDKRGRTALHYAARHGHVECVQQLLNKGVLIDASDSRGQTPLHLAARWGHANVLSVLASAKGNTHARDARGQLPLHLCARYGHLSCVALLCCEWNALESDVYTKDANGQTPPDLAFDYGHYSVVRKFDELLRRQAGLDIVEEDNVEGGNLGSSVVERSLEKQKNSAEKVVVIDDMEEEESATLPFDHVNDKNSSDSESDSDSDNAHGEGSTISDIEDALAERRRQRPSKNKKQHNDNSDSDDEGPLIYEDYGRLAGPISHELEEEELVEFESSDKSKEDDEEHTPSTSQNSSTQVTSSSPKSPRSPRSPRASSPLQELDDFLQKQSPGDIKSPKSPPPRPYSPPLPRRRSAGSLSSPRSPRSPNESSPAHSPLTSPTGSSLRSISYPSFSPRSNTLLDRLRKVQLALRETNDTLQETITQTLTTAPSSMPTMSTPSPTKIDSYQYLGQLIALLTEAKLAITAVQSHLRAQRKTLRSRQRCRLELIREKELIHSERIVTHSTHKAVYLRSRDKVSLFHSPGSFYFRAYSVAFC